MLPPAKMVAPQRKDAQMDVTRIITKTPSGHYTIRLFPWSEPEVVAPERVALLVDLFITALDEEG